MTDDKTLVFHAVPIFDNGERAIKICDPFHLPWGVGFVHNPTLKTEHTLPEDSWYVLHTSKEKIDSSYTLLIVWHGAAGTSHTRMLFDREPHAAFGAVVDAMQSQTTVVTEKDSHGSLKSLGEDT